MIFPVGPFRDLVLLPVAVAAEWDCKPVVWLLAHPGLALTDCRVAKANMRRLGSGIVPADKTRQPTDEFQVGIGSDSRCSNHD